VGGGGGSTGPWLLHQEISPRRAKLGDLPRGMRSVDAPPPTSAAGAPPAGPWQEPNRVYRAA
jgi:hypothetical protein